MRPPPTEPLPDLPSRRSGEVASSRGSSSGERPFTALSGSSFAQRMSVDSSRRSSTWSNASGVDLKSEVDDTEAEDATYEQVMPRRVEEEAAAQAIDVNETTKRKSQQSADAAGEDEETELQSSRPLSFISNADTEMGPGVATAAGEGEGNVEEPAQGGFVKSTTIDAIGRRLSKSSNASFVALYQRSSVSDVERSSFEAGSTGNTAPSTPTHTSFSPSTLQTPSISIDEVDSDATISEGETGNRDDDADTPRKKRRQKSHSSRSMGFDEQRAMLPSVRKSSAKLVPPRPDQAPEPPEKDPFAFYSFSPDLPPFVPQGLKPMDLTGRGTWASIAARSGITSPPSVSRSTSFSTISPSTSGDSCFSQSQGPVSMKKLAAETRARQKDAKEYQQRQASLLSAKSWLPTDIHAHAIEHGADYAASLQPFGHGEHHGRASQQSLHSMGSTSHLSAMSFNSHHSVGVAFDFNARAYPALSRTASIGSQYGHMSEASVGSEPMRPVKQYREFSQQTTPPASPEPSESGLHGRSEAGVGADADPEDPSADVELAKVGGGVGSDARRARRHLHVMKKQNSALSHLSRSAWGSDDDDEDERRAHTPTQATPSRRLTRLRSPAANDTLDDGEWPALKIRTPRLTSRRSNIGTNPYASSSSFRNSTLSLDGGNGSDSTLGQQTISRGRLSMGGYVQDESSRDDSDADDDDDDSDSGESDLDITTPAQELAAQTGAFDAIVQSRGSKRKLQQAKSSPGGTARATAAQRTIAGSGRVKASIISGKASVGNGTSASPRGGFRLPKASLTRGGGAGKSVDELATEIANLAVSLSAPASPRGLSARTKAMQLSPSPSPSSRSFTTPRRLVARSDSPDLEESFRSSGVESHGEENEDDEEESLMLSELDFPAPSKARPSLQAVKRASNEAAAKQSPSAKSTFSSPFDTPSTVATSSDGWSSLPRFRDSATSVATSVYHQRDSIQTKHESGSASKYASLDTPLAEEVVEDEDKEESGNATDGAAGPRLSTATDRSLTETEVDEAKTPPDFGKLPLIDEEIKHPRSSSHGHDFEHHEEEDVNGVRVEHGIALIAPPPDPSASPSFNRGWNGGDDNEVPQASPRPRAAVPRSSLPTPSSRGAAKGLKSPTPVRRPSDSRGTPSPISPRLSGIRPPASSALLSAQARSLGTSSPTTTSSSPVLSPTTPKASPLSLGAPITLKKSPMPSPRTGLARPTPVKRVSSGIPPPSPVTAPRGSSGGGTAIPRPPSALPVSAGRGTK